MKKYAKAYTITSAQMDPDFRLSVTGMAQLFQDCFASYMAYYRCAAFDLRQRGLMWIISDFTFAVTAPLPMWGENIELELWLSSRPTVKVNCDYVFRHGGQTFACGTSAWAILEADTRKPVLSRNILAENEVCQEQAMAGKRIHCGVPSQGFATCFHITNSSDTDFNSHISNLTYLRVAIDSLDINYVRSHPIRMVSLKFVHESFLGDKLESRFSNDSQNPDLWTFSIGRDSNTVCCRAALLFDSTECVSPEFGTDSEIRKYRQ